MKKLLLSLTAMIAMLATSCVTDATNDLSVGNESVVTFSVESQNASRADIANGAKATRLQYAVFSADEDGTPITYLRDLSSETKGIVEFENLKASFDLTLLNQNYYTIVFWAYAPGSIYGFDAEHAIVTANYKDEDGNSIVNANDDNLDAFYAVVPFRVNGTTVVEAKLKRPFAQVNFATNDVAKAATAGFDTENLHSTFTAHIYNSLNLVSGELSGEDTVTFKLNGVPSENETCKEGYRWVAMNYVFASENGGSLSTCELTITDNDTLNNGKSVSISYPNAPVKRNWRTNLIGALLTNSTNVNVEVDPGFGGEEDHNYPFVGVVAADGTAVTYNTFAEAWDAVTLARSSEPATIRVRGNVDLGTTNGTAYTLPAGQSVVLDLGGATLNHFSDGDSGNQIAFDVRGNMTVNGGTITTKHTGADLEWSAMTEVFYVGFNGTLNLKNTHIENLGGSAMAYAVDLVNAAAPGGVTLNVENSYLKSSYIPVRVFNNGAGMNNVTIKNSTLEGTSRAFWVHVYSNADNGGKGVKSATLNIDIFNPESNNIFIAENPNRLIEYGFTDEINVTPEGVIVIKDAEGNVIDGIGMDLEGNYAVTKAAGLMWVADQVNGGNTLAGETVKLVADIDLAGVDFYSIGYNNNDKKYFEGTFDGNNKTIKNLSRWDSTYASKRAVGLFAQVKNATVKNLTMENFVAATYGGEAAAIACEAVGDCTFENLTFKNGSVVSYNNDTAPVIGWANKGNFTLKNITVESDVVIYSLWDSHDTTLGGLIGTLESPSTVSIENATVSCVLNAFNDVCGNYQWYNYRRTGMVIGNMYETQTIDGRELPNPAAAGVTCKNVTVNYGDWMNYHYCEFEANGVPSYADPGDWKFSRVEGQEWGRESNIDTDNCQHDTDESHNICLPVDQLFGGGQGVSGLREYAGVTVNYPASYRREVSSAAALTEALGKGVSVILDADIDFGTTQLAITGENQVVDLGGHALTTANNWGGISLKNGASIKNGTITHAGNTAAIKAFNGSSVENVTINATCATADKTVTGIAVQQGANVESIKNVTINGVSQGIEVGYQATVGLIENAVVNESNNGTAKGIALVINGGKVGKAKDCTFKGETYGVTMHLKGVFAVGLELENCHVEGTTASIYAWDEKGVSNTSGSLVLTYDAATTLTGPFVWDFEEECQSVVTLNRPQ